MRKITLTLLLAILSLSTSYAQSAETGVQGRIVDENNEPISFANVILFQSQDSAMAKTSYSGEDGNFAFTHITPGTYYLNISFVGYDTYASQTLNIAADQMQSLGIIKMEPFASELGEVVVATTRPIVEVKPDKTVFNVEGSVNSIGYNALELLRKAPGVVVDNNDRLMLIGKSGVKVYIDGKQSILSSDDLSNYLKSLQSTQIESIEIITQPSSRYEAEGNAGIINIRLIKDKSLGTNATISLEHSQSTHGRINANVNVNNRTQKMNVFGNVNYSLGESSNYQLFQRTTPALFVDQNNIGINEWNNLGLRAGVDVYTGKNSTVGVLFDGYTNNDEWNSHVVSRIAADPQSPTTEILEGFNNVQNDRDNYNVNGNYRFDNKKGTVLNLDLDYGKFENKGNSYQPNYYYNAETNELIDTRIFRANTPTSIDIKTFKLDFEKPIFGGTAGAGVKIAQITTDNTYDFFDIIDGNPVLNIDRSNQFVYEENINAGYVNFNRQWEKIGLQLGVRVEETDSQGDLMSHKPGGDETVVQDYLEFFPSGGLTYQVSQKHSLRLGYSRRIDRPNYQDLNPFEFKLDELTFQKGNPFLRPQFSNSFSLTHTFNYTLNTTLSYSHTNDLMAELTDTSGTDGAAFIRTENIAEQDLVSLSISYPFSLSKSWNVFANTSVTNSHNEADFGQGRIVDISATMFNIYMQHSFMLPKKFTFEVSGWYNSPGIWGGNFKSGEMWSIDAGIQKKIFNDRGNLKLAVSDIFKSQEWSGENNFGALKMTAMGGWESRQVKLNFTYLVGNTDVKGSRRRSTGLEDESKRIK
jgi:iron complex outermembrane receptor protein